MEEFVKREPRTVDNSQWRERHQFLLYANGNIICQRYFKVNGFNPKSLESEELLETFYEVLGMIKNDLDEKSRIYATHNYLPQRLKMTGFVKDEDILTYEDYRVVMDSYVEGEVTLSNGKTIVKEYFDEEGEDDDDKFTFKFVYLYNERPIYEAVWDGSVYPKFVRNNVDLSNSKRAYEGRDPQTLSYTLNMTRLLTEGRPDLIWHIIHKLCVTLSNSVDDEGNSVEKVYTHKVKYGDKTYGYNKYGYMRDWANATRKKTIEYQRWVNNEMSDGKWNYINNKL